MGTSSFPNSTLAVTQLSCGRYPNPSREGWGRPVLGSTYRPFGAELAALVGAILGESGVGGGAASRPEDRRPVVTGVIGGRRPRRAAPPGSRRAGSGRGCSSIAVLVAVVLLEVAFLRDDIATDVDLLLDAGRSESAPSARRSRTACRSCHLPRQRPGPCLGVDLRTLRSRACRARRAPCVFWSGSSRHPIRRLSPGRSALWTAARVPRKTPGGSYRAARGRAGHGRSTRSRYRPRRPWRSSRSRRCRRPRPPRRCSSARASPSDRAREPRGGGRHAHHRAGWGRPSVPQRPRRRRTRQQRRNIWSGASTCSPWWPRWRWSGLGLVEPVPHRRDGARRAAGDDRRGRRARPRAVLAGPRPVPRRPGLGRLRRGRAAPRRRTGGGPVRERSHPVDRDRPRQLPALGAGEARAAARPRRRPRLEPSGVAALLAGGAACPSYRSRSPWRSRTSARPPCSPSSPGPCSSSGACPPAVPAAADRRGWPSRHRS